MFEQLLFVLYYSKLFLTDEMQYRINFSKQWNNRVISEKLHMFDFDFRVSYIIMKN